MSQHRTVAGQRFRRGDRVFHVKRPEIPGMVTQQHRRDEQPIAQYAVEWERSPFGYGKQRVTHEWEADLRVLR